MKLPKMIEGNFEPHFALKHMLKDMKIASQLGLSHHIELATTTAARDRLLEQEQRGYSEEDFSVIVRKYFPEAQIPAVEQDLELFEKPPPLEPDATISSMGEVAAAVQDGDLAPPPPEPLPTPEPEPAFEQFIPVQVPMEQAVPAPVESAQPQTPPAEQPVPPQPEVEQQGSLEAGAEKPPMDMLAKLLRGDSIFPDQSK
jgi:hypothetical protein